MPSLLSRTLLATALLFSANAAMAQMSGDVDGDSLLPLDPGTARPPVRIYEPAQNRFYESVAINDSTTRLFYYGAEDKKLQFAVDMPNDSNGVQVHYTPNGEVAEIDTLVNGQKNGIVRIYENGKLQSLETWQNGVQQGIEIDYSENGEIARVAFIDGEKFKEGAINTTDTKKTRELTAKLRRLQFWDNMKRPFDGRTTRRKTYDQRMKLQSS